MDKLLNKSKSMIFGRKKAKEDNTVRDSESFYDLDDYSLSSSSPRIQTQALASKTKLPLPIKPPAQFAHAQPSGPGLGERHGFYNANPNPYPSFRRDTQPAQQHRHKPLPLARSSSTSEAKPPTLSLNAHAGERYRLEVNFERNRSATAIYSHGPLRNYNQLHLTNTNTSKNEDLDPRSGPKDGKATFRTNSCQLPDTSFRGCAISAPITNGSLTSETKFDPSTGRSNLPAFRASADSVLTKHIPTLTTSPGIFSNRAAVSSNENVQQNVPHASAPSGGKFSPLRGRRSLNVFTATNSTLNSEVSTVSSSNNEKRNLSSSLLQRSSNPQGSTSSDSQYGPLSNWVRYEAQNNSRSESAMSKPISSPILINDNDGRSRPFQFKTTSSDNLVQLNGVQPLSLRSQPRIRQKKFDGPSDTEANEKPKIESPSPNLYDLSSVLQASASLPTPPTSTTTLSFITGQLDIPEFDTNRGEKARILYGDDGKCECTKTSPSTLTRADLETALKFQNRKINELCERVSSLSDQLNDEVTSRKLFGKRMSHLENEIQGLRWIISERDRERVMGSSEIPVVDSQSRGSSGRIGSEDSGSRYEASRTSNTTEKDSTERGKYRDENDRVVIGSSAKPLPRTTLTVTTQRADSSAYGFNAASKTTSNRRKRFGLALDPSPDSTPTGPSSLRSSSQVQAHLAAGSNTPSQSWGGKV